MEKKSALSPFIEAVGNNSEQRPGEVIYQIYPSSFADADGDGLGDIKGITSKLDYIKTLGADALWLSPFYVSPAGPEGDGGYAVTDYRGIDPRFGTMDDFKEMLDAAHERGLRVYIDFVIAHTANDHEWFEKSRNREEPYTNYYVWHDGWKVDRGHDGPPADWKHNPQGEAWTQNKEDGTWTQHYVPNNWKSVFGGLAWEWDEKREQYYMHHFLKSQPSLDLNRKEVQDASLGEMKFWLDMGVDGFRIDALPFANYDPQFRHNPWLDGQWPRQHEGWGDQRFDHSLCQPQTIDLAARVRELMDSYPDKRTTLGEAVCGPYGGGGSIPVAASYVDTDRGLDMCYTDALTQIHEYPSQRRLKDMLGYLLNTFPASGGHCNSVDNHDTPRSGTRMTAHVPEGHKPMVLRQLMKIFATLPGSFSMYQGQELGLSQARVPEDIPRHMQKDPTAFTLGSGRDGCRTPMPWKAAEKNTGFTDSDQPYLPVPHSHNRLAVDVQDAAPDSHLNFVRRLLAWRKEQPALIHGETAVIDNGGDVFAFVRQSKEQTMLCLFNMSGHPQRFTPSDHLGGELLQKLNIKAGQAIEVDAYGAEFRGANPLRPCINRRPADPRLAP